MITVHLSAESLHALQILFHFCRHCKRGTMKCRFCTEFREFLKAIFEVQRQRALEAEGEECDLEGELINYLDFYNVNGEGPKNKTKNIWL